MSFSQLVFSSKGRVRRRTYWLFAICSGLLSYVALAIDFGLGTFSRDTGIGIVQIIYTLIALIPGILVAVKRAHDRDHSGWFLLILFIPLVNLWPAIELAFLPGTSGPNKYGPDPKQPQVQPVAVM